jgi:hypothetical protein
MFGSKAQRRQTGTWVDDDTKYQDTATTARALPDAEEGLSLKADPTETQPAPPVANPRIRRRTELEPLTPKFDPAQHQPYVDHLNEALTKSKVLNIALTGRYGSGKSSVLERFADQEHVKKHVLFLALSTLGPSSEGSDAGVPESRTNRIEKELVKQLLHREKPSRLRQSRYQRIVALPRWRAVCEAVTALATLVLCLWAFGVLPSLPGLSKDHVWWARLGTAALLAPSAVAALTWLRLALHNRFVVSEVSAAGASISLAGKTGSYFDEYLDEIVYFFESMRSIDVVIFEDLDRFDDPGIFEALRELNTLLNNSKQTDGRTIRFVYALRDSIFERLGTDSADEDHDAARTETQRANRTKFFDLVIPIVPFITHRSSRDLLSGILEDDSRGSVVPVSAGLVNLTAQHLPDMRLLRNVRNEFAVFADRLITNQGGIQGLDADRLFALVVYKNVHLGDFEDILLGKSKLDDLYRHSRALVSEAIAVRRTRLRRLDDEVAIPKRRAELAEVRGRRLTWFAKALLKTQAHNPSLSKFNIGNTEFTKGQVETVEFWDTLIAQNTGLVVAYTTQGYGSGAVQVEMSDLREMFGNPLTPDEWEVPDEAERARERSALSRDLETLRIADFKALAAQESFVLTQGGEKMTFPELLDRHIDSDVARALITEGYIDRYYTLYVSQYYGTHVPPNAMNFIRQNVDPNIADFYYRFENPEEIDAVLSETDDSFLTDTSAQNIGLLDHLIERADPRSNTVLDAIVRRMGDSESAFLVAYFSEGRHAASGVAYLARTWPGILVQLVAMDLSEADRLRFVDEALANSDSKVDYGVGPDVERFLRDNYSRLPSITAHKEPSAKATEGALMSGAEPAAQDRTRRTTEFMARSRITCTDLSALTPVAVGLIVDRGRYEITAENLRTAVPDVATISLNNLKPHSRVYERVLTAPYEYLTAIEADSTGVATSRAASSGDASEDEEAIASRTLWSIDDSSTFADIVRDLSDNSVGDAAALITRAHPDCEIEDLASLPNATWDALSVTGRYSVTVSNLTTLLEYLGGVTEDLGATLASAERIIVPTTEGDSKELRASTVVIADAVLKASDHLPDPAKRVRLVSSLDLEDWLPVENVRPEPGPLLGLLIGEEVCADEAALFERFAPFDWDTLGFAVSKSSNFADFMSPTWVDAVMRRHLMLEGSVPGAIKLAMLARFDEFIDDDAGTLSAAGKAALETNAHLDVAHLGQIASGTNDADLVVDLLHHAGRTIGVDDVIGILSRLPAPYGELSVPGAAVTLDRDEHLDAVINRLRDGGRITTKAKRKARNRPARTEVTVL